MRPAAPPRSQARGSHSPLREAQTQAPHRPWECGTLPSAWSSSPEISGEDGSFLISSGVHLEALKLSPGSTALLPGMTTRRAYGALWKLRQEDENIPIRAWQLKESYVKIKSNTVILDRGPGCSVQTAGIL